ncbi:DUF2771 domain-containing protein [Rhodococcus sp. NPDC058521]|uniref:DUF2771 domain-containing protein n=1 Tax=Rhodococcus sp. NPDC058521 TaxID=3346536 RepID=UPI0036615C4B
MNLQTRTKKIVALVAAGLLVVAVAFGAVITLLVRGAESTPPELTAYAHGKSIQVAPLAHCSLYLEDCVEGDTAELDVPVGYPLQISVPKAISEAPWRIVEVYASPEGEPVLDARNFTPGSTTSVTVESTEEQQLVGVEIQLPSAVVDDQGFPHVRAVWSIATA